MLAHCEHLGITVDDMTRSREAAEHRDDDEPDDVDRW
jgi:hypothetical protein